MSVSASAMSMIACEGGQHEQVSPEVRRESEQSGARAYHAPRFQFTDVTAVSGLRHVMTSGRFPSTQILEVKGGGIALIDFDNDGDADIFVPNGATLKDTEHGPGWKLFENLGEMRFVDISARAGITQTRWAFGAAVGDFDNDGYDDIYVTCFGPNVLLRNTGQGGFVDVSESARVGYGGWSSAAAWADIDGDGDLDLYVVSYLSFDPEHPPPASQFRGVPVFAGPMGFVPEADALFENMGDGTFRDISVESGIRAVLPSYGLGVVILDFTGDHRLDIFVGNDSMANFLFVNEGGSRFIDRGFESGIAVNEDGSAQATMGIAIADIDGNGRPDVFTSNFSSDTNTLHLNMGSNLFVDATRRYGLGLVSRPYLGWAAAFYDFDHDTSEDLLVFNGHVYPTASRETMDSDYRQRALLFRRLEQRFELLSEAETRGALAEAHCDRGAAFGDLDNDGDVDVVVAELNGPVRVLRNDALPGNWIMVAIPTRYFGARVEARCEGRSWRRWIHSGGSFLSSSMPSAHFVLPAESKTVDLEIVLSDGTAIQLDAQPTRQRIMVFPDRDLP